MSEIRELQDARYISLATFRKSGDEVATPIWAARDGDTYYAFSAGDAGKVKRLRNSPKARLAKCDVKGKLLGDWHGAHAVIIDDPSQITKALAALRNKYGFQMWLADVGARLSGRFDRRAYLAIRLQDE